MCIVIVVVWASPAATKFLHTEVIQANLWKVSKSFNTFSIVSFPPTILPHPPPMNSNCTLSLMVWMHTKAISLTLTLSPFTNLSFGTFFPLPPTPFFAVISTENIYSKEHWRKVFGCNKKSRNKKSLFSSFLCAYQREKNTSIITLQSRNCFSLSLFLWSFAFSHFFLWNVHTFLWFEFF